MSLEPLCCVGFLVSRGSGEIGKAQDKRGKKIIRGTKIGLRKKKKLNMVLVTHFLFILNKFITWEVVVPGSILITCSSF